MQWDTPDGESEPGENKISSRVVYVSLALFIIATFFIAVATGQ